MDLQSYLDSVLKASRAETMAKSDQLTLGEIISRCEAIPSSDSEPNVVYDFEYLHPVSIGSWRGSYSELALDFSDDNIEMKLSVFISILKDSVGHTFTGYKGGEFTMSRHTPVWVANYGNSGNTAVIDVVDNGYQIILMTGYREF